MSAGAYSSCLRVEGGVTPRTSRHFVAGLHRHKQPCVLALALTANFKVASYSNAKRRQEEAGVPREPTHTQGGQESAHSQSQNLLAAGRLY